MGELRTGDSRLRQGETRLVQLLTGAPQLAGNVSSFTQSEGKRMLIASMTDAPLVAKIFGIVWLLHITSCHLLKPSLFLLFQRANLPKVNFGILVKHILIWGENETAKEGSKAGLTVACFLWWWLLSTFLGAERMEAVLATLDWRLLLVNVHLLMAGQATGCYCMSTSFLILFPLHYPTVTPAEQDVQTLLKMTPLIYLLFTCTHS